MQIWKTVGGAENGIPGGFSQWWELEDSGRMTASDYGEPWRRRRHSFRTSQKETSV